MASDALRPAAVCRVGDTLTVRVAQRPDGSWSYAARVLWVRDAHVGLTPPPGTHWQQLLQPGRPVWLEIRQEAISARLRLIIVGLSADLPPVLVLHQASSSQPSAGALRQATR